MHLRRAGGGMFVGCVVAGSVMLVGSGAAVRGALIRDVSAYAIAASAVALMLHSGQVIMENTSFAHAIAASASFLGHHWASCAAPMMFCVQAVTTSLM